MAEHDRRAQLEAESPPGAGKLPVEVFLGLLHQHLLLLGRGAQLPVLELDRQHDHPEYGEQRQQMHTTKVRKKPQISKALEILAVWRKMTIFARYLKPAYGFGAMGFGPDPS